MKTVHNYGYERFRWEGLKLYHESKFMVELIPHEIYDNHYHLKFMWRTEKTDEFFNIVNARENSKRITLYRLNYDMWETPSGGTVGAFK